MFIVCNYEVNKVGHATFFETGTYTILFIYCQVFCTFIIYVLIINHKQKIKVTNNMKNSAHENSYSF